MNISRITAYEIGALFALDLVKCTSANDLGERLQYHKYPREIREKAADCNWNLSLDDGMARRPNNS